MSRHRYPHSALLADLSRGLIGLLVCTILITVVRPADWLVWILMAFAALFAIHVYRVLTRCRYCVEIDANSLREFATPASDVALRRLDWTALDGLDLDYFCTRRDGRGGWLQLRLRSHGSTVRLDSRLLGFERVLARAVDAARECGIELSATTTSNLLAIGFDGKFNGPGDDLGNDLGNDLGDGRRVKDPHAGLAGSRGGIMGGKVKVDTQDSTQ